MGDAAKNLYKQQGTYRTALYCWSHTLTHTDTPCTTRHIASDARRLYDYICQFSHLQYHSGSYLYSYSHSFLTHSNIPTLTPTYGPPGINGFYRGIEANVMRAMVRTHAQTRVLTHEYIAAHTHSCTQTRHFLLSVPSFDTCLFISSLPSLHISSHSFLLFPRRF